ncbi:MAG: hypothetical protein V3U48_00655 [Rhodospirillales bacterium]
MADLGYATGGYREPETGEESLLLNRLKRVEANPTGVYAVHLHLSKLRTSNQQPHFIKIAARTFDGLTENFEATVFPLHNADLVVICRNVPVDDADAAVDKVRSLFSEDPLLTTQDGAFEDNFSTWYDLSQPEDFSAFVSIANDLAVEAQRTRQHQAETQETEDKDMGEPLGAMNLAAINQKLQGTRVADLIREQTCLLMGPGGPGGIVFRENFVSMAELKKRIAPDVNLFASPWLFQYLTETLDKRMLAVLSNRDIEGMASPVSLNLNVGTILSRDFQKFHQAVGKYASKIIIEMQVIDIFADMSTFGYARDTLQERGYRVLVDGLSPLSLQFFDPGDLQSDFVKINWGTEYEGDTDAARIAQMRDVVSSTGKDSVILARVDTEEAVKWGLALGVSRFQGYFIDDLMTKLAEVQIQKAKAQARAKAKAKPQPAPAQPQPAAQPAQPAQPAPAQPQPVTQPSPVQPQPAAAPVPPQQQPPAQPQSQPAAQPAQPVPAQPQPAPVQPQPAAAPAPLQPQPQPAAQPAPAPPQQQPPAQPQPQPAVQPAAQPAAAPAQPQPPAQPKPAPKA